MKRYARHSSYGFSDLVENPYGDWVQYSEVEKLVEQNAQMLDALKVTENFVHKYIDGLEAPPDAWSLLSKVELAVAVAEGWFGNNDKQGEQQ